MGTGVSKSRKPLSKSAKITLYIIIALLLAGGIACAIIGAMGLFPGQRNNKSDNDGSAPQSVTPQPVPVAAPQPVPVAAPQPVPVAAPQPVPVAAPQPVPVAAPQPVPVAAPQPVPVAVQSDLYCNTDADCENDSNGPTCVIQDDENYAQCVDCSEEAFNNSCAYWTEDLRTAAEKKCDRTCQPPQPTQSDLDCNTDADCENDSNGPTCVIQDDGYYAQCVDCSETKFNNSCTYWGDDLRTAAEKKCDRTCPSV